MDKTKIPYVFEMPEYFTDEYINWETQDRSKEKRENSWITVYEGVARGRVIGGNLNTMQGIWGSKYMPQIEDGDILSGIILGKHELFDDLNTGRKPYEILLEVLGDKKLPFIADFDCCHTHPMFTLPIGCEIELNASEKKVSII